MITVNNKTPKIVFERHKLKIFAIFLVATLLFNASEAVLANTAPRLLTYSEIVQLYNQKTPTTALGARLDELLTTPFVVNNQSLRQNRKQSSTEPQIGQFLRVAFWNIERGIELELIKLAQL